MSVGYTNKLGIKGRNQKNRGTHGLRHCIYNKCWVLNAIAVPNGCLLSMHDDYTLLASSDYTSLKTLVNYIIF